MSDSEFPVEVRAESIDLLDAHASIPIAFLVDCVLDVSVVDRQFVVTERVIDEPWVKDYDAIRGEGPTSWAKRFDISAWGLLAAYASNERVGGAVVAVDSSRDLLLGRHDLAVIWDLRVRPEWRQRGVGSALLREVESWSRNRGMTRLHVETQDINAGACRLYSRAGFALESVRPDAYPGLQELQLIWSKDL